MNDLLEVRPVVEARARDGLVVEMETERPHQVESHAEPDAQSADGPRVVGDFRSQEHNREVHNLWQVSELEADGAVADGFGLKLP